ncbi:hypothetical protein [uncultured Sulfitobacter sp.]|nr:hypothetical protein [uncultured Sulfitobacter sp.]
MRLAVNVRVGPDKPMRCPRDFPILQLHKKLSPRSAINMTESAG